MNIYFNVLTETLGKVYSLLISRLYKPEKKSRKQVLKKVSLSFWKTYHLNNESLSQRCISDYSKDFNSVAAISVLTTLKPALTILFNHLNTRRSRFNHRETRISRGFNDPL